MRCVLEEGLDVIEPDRCEYISSIDDMQCELFLGHDMPHIVVAVRGARDET